MFSRVVLYLWVVPLQLHAFQNENGIELSCFRSYVTDSESFCYMVDWRTARSYDKAGYNVYEPKNELSKKEQDDYAQYLYETYSPSGEDVECRNGLRRTICSLVFPECLDEGKSSSGVSYYQTCKGQCDQMRSCSFDYEDICQGFPVDNCAILVAPGFFVLEPEKGPYGNLPIVYGAMLGVWFVLATLWHYMVFYVYRDSGALVCRAIAGLPLIKMVALSIGVSFWATCEKWGMCSFWLSVAYVNTNLIFDTCLMGSFMLISKGWSITRQIVPPQEWRVVLVLMSTFYLATSINLVLEASVYTTTGFWISNIVVYGIVYLNIVQSTLEQIKTIKTQVDPFKNANYSRDIVGPLKMKFRMYILFLVLVFSFMATEILTHSLLFTDERVWVALTFFELSQLLLIVLIGFFFRPREFSPFFFMVQTTMNDQRARPTPIVEVDIDNCLNDDEAEDGGEVDVTPLLRHTRLTGPTPSTMVFLKQPDGNVNLGVQTKQRTSGRDKGSKGGSTGGSSRQLVENRSFVDLTLNGNTGASTSNGPSYSRQPLQNGSGSAMFAAQSEELEMRPFRRNDNV